MKKVILAVVASLVVYLGVIHLQHKSALDGYKEGCKDVMTSLLEKLGVNNIDDDSLNTYCDALSKKYVRK